MPGRVGRDLFGCREEGCTIGGKSILIILLRMMGKHIPSGVG